MHCQCHIPEPLPPVLVVMFAGQAEIESYLPAGIVRQFLRRVTVTDQCGEDMPDREFISRWRMGL